MGQEKVFKAFLMILVQNEIYLKNLKEYIERNSMI